MNQSIGITIKELRKRYGFTQESFAKQVGVSAAAVSKWENGNSFPDITLLPKLAQLLHTSIDQLFSYHQSLSKEEVAKLETTLTNQFEEKGFNMVYKNLIAYFEEYPNDTYLKFRLGYIIFQNIPRLTEESEAEKVLDQLIHLFEEIVSDITFEYRNEAIYFLSSLYISNEQLETACEIVEELPAYSNVKKEPLLANLYLSQGKYQDALQLTQTLLFTEVREAYNHLLSLSIISSKLDDTKLSLQLLLTMKQLEELFQLDQIYSQTDYYLADYFAKKQDYEKAILYLKNWIEPSPKSDLKHSPFFNTLKLKESNITVAYSNELSKKMLDDNSNFDFLKSTIEYQNLVSKLNTK